MAPSAPQAGIRRKAGHQWNFSLLNNMIICLETPYKHLDNTTKQDISPGCDSEYTLVKLTPSEHGSTTDLWGIPVRSGGFECLTVYL